MENNVVVIPSTQRGTHTQADMFTSSTAMPHKVDRFVLWAGLIFYGIVFVFLAAFLTKRWRDGRLPSCIAALISSGQLGTFADSSPAASGLGKRRDIKSQAPRWQSAGRAVRRLLPFGNSNARKTKDEGDDAGDACPV